METKLSEQTIYFQQVTLWKILRIADPAGPPDPVEKQTRRTHPQTCTDHPCGKPETGDENHLELRANGLSQGVDKGVENLVVLPQFFYLADGMNHR